MKKYIAIIMTLVFIFTVALVGCEKKAEPPKVEQPIVAPAAPAPVPVPAPAPAKPAPAPAKPAKK